MSKSARRIFAAMSLAAALLLVVPAPSWAGQARKPAPSHNVSLWAQAWTWLESLLGDSRTTPTVQRKDGIMTSPPLLPPPPDQGPMIDPNGGPK